MVGSLPEDGGVGVDGGHVRLVPSCLLLVTLYLHTCINGLVPAEHHPLISWHNLGSGASLNLMKELSTGVMTPALAPQFSCLLGKLKSYNI